MRFWIDKENEMLPENEWKDSYIFSLKRDSHSTIFTSIADTWYWMDCMSIPTIYEDLFIIGISIFALDKRIERKQFVDCWTRDISVNIPVIEIDKWLGTEEKWNKMLAFLTGDNWSIYFRKSEKVYSQRSNPNRKHLRLDECDCVSLFSGGLDSYCGAIKLLEEGKSPCLIGHNEYPKLKRKQQGFVEKFQEIYTEQNVKFVSFSANSRMPKKLTGEGLMGTENTSRGRSLLFLCAGISIAGILGKEMPVYIPENGFIGLNIPLTQSRNGTCSTRTTHPYFLNCFQEILARVGIQNPIINFYAYSTKREIINEVKNTEAFASYYKETISCSHPCQARYDIRWKMEYPINCGYCYPCLIRKSSLLDAKDERYSHLREEKDYMEIYDSKDRGSDLRAVISAVYRFKKMDDGEIKRMIRLAGHLEEDAVQKFLHVYKSTMQDLEELLLQNDDIRKIIEE